MLLTEDTNMPETNVGDLRDVVDAINRLCENMTPNYDSKSDSFDSVETGSQDAPCLSQDVVNLLQDVANFTSNTAAEPVVDEYDYFDDIRNKYVDKSWFDNNQKAQIVNQANETQIANLGLIHNDVIEEISQAQVANEHLVDVRFKNRDAEALPVNVDSVQVDVRKSDVCTQRWSDNSQISLPGQTVEVEIVTSDIENVLAHCETASEVYYSASSEVSLTSDIETAERMEDTMLSLTHDNLMLADNVLLIEDIPLAQDNQLSRDNSLNASEIRNERDCVVSGHVAAMRERFENMTRSNTPSDLFRSFSPSLDRVPTPDLKG